jgi:hypothetical protein
MFVTSNNFVIRHSVTSLTLYAQLVCVRVQSSKRSQIGSIATVYPLRVCTRLEERVTEDANADTKMLVLNDLIRSMLLLACANLR